MTGVLLSYRKGGVVFKSWAVFKRIRYVWNNPPDVGAEKFTLVPMGEGPMNHAFKKRLISNVQLFKVGDQGSKCTTKLSQNQVLH